jgi:hypothetical protein
MDPAMRFRKREKNPEINVAVRRQPRARGRDVGMLQTKLLAIGKRHGMRRYMQAKLYRHTART